MEFSPALQRLKNELALAKPDVDIWSALVRRNTEFLRAARLAIRSLEDLEQSVMMLNGALPTCRSLITHVKGIIKDEQQRLLNKRKRSARLRKALSIKAELDDLNYRILKAKEDTAAHWTRAKQWFERRVAQLNELSEEVRRRYGPNLGIHLRHPEFPQLNINI